MKCTREVYNGKGKVILVEEYEIPDDIINIGVAEARAEAYRDEADPLFFKAQRGEIEQQVWLDKIAEIKQRLPKTGDKNGKSNSN